MSRFDRASLARYVQDAERATRTQNRDTAGSGVQKGAATRVHPAWLAAIGAANGADLVSTELALSKNPDAYEANPLLKGSAGKRAAIKGALTLGEILATRVVGKSNPKAAKTLAAILTALPAALTVNNLRQAKR
jgi:hypothetical protein